MRGLDCRKSVWINTLFSVDDQRALITLPCLMECDYQKDRAHPKPRNIPVFPGSVNTSKTEIRIVTPPLLTLCEMHYKQVPFRKSANMAASALLISQFLFHLNEKREDANHRAKGLHMKYRNYLLVFMATFTLYGRSKGNLRIKE